MSRPSIAVDKPSRRRCSAWENESQLRRRSTPREIIDAKHDLHRDQCDKGESCRRVGGERQELIQGKLKGRMSAFDHAPKGGNAIRTVSHAW
jgi:hypothetical protein